MPLYEYKCRLCGHMEEKLRSYEERDDTVVCPKEHAKLIVPKMKRVEISRGAYRRDHTTLDPRFM